MITVCDYKYVVRLRKCTFNCSFSKNIYVVRLRKSCKMGTYKLINLANPELYHIERKYEISIQEAYNGNFDKLIRSVKSQKFIKISVDGTVILYGEGKASKRFPIYWLILVNAKPELIPEDILEKKWHVIHKDGVFENHHPDNLEWSTKQVRCGQRATGRETWTEDGVIHNSITEAKKTGHRFKRVTRELDDGEYYIRTGVFNQLARETGFPKFRKVRVTSRGRILMHDGRLIKGTASYSGKHLMNKHRSVFIGGKTYKVQRLVAMAKFNKVLSSDTNLDSGNNLDEEGLERNWIEDIKIV